MTPYRYLITIPNKEPFLSHWFDADNHFNAELGMVVFDLANGLYTTDGKNWKELNENHL